MPDGFYVICFVAFLGFLIGYPLYYKSTRGEEPMNQGRAWGGFAASILIGFPMLHEPSFLGVLSVVTGIAIFCYIYKLNLATCGSVGHAIALTAWQTTTILTIVVVVLWILLEIQNAMEEGKKKERK